MTISIEKCEAAVKQMLVANYFATYYGRISPDEFVDCLHRIFRQKKKVIRHLALYVQKEAAKGHNPEKALSHLDFFAVVMKDFLGKNNNQPTRR